MHAFERRSLTTNYYLKIARWHPIIFYCYDAYCGWCYGFSPVMKKFAEEYKQQFSFEVLSGGMIISETPRPISVMAGYISEAYKVVEERTGIRFGSDFLWHINNPDKSDWFLDSEKSAIAFVFLKNIYPGQQVDFAADLQYALNYEGRDLCDDEAYRHLLENILYPQEIFIPACTVKNTRRKPIMNSHW